MCVHDYWNPYIAGAFLQLALPMIIHNPEDYAEAVKLIPTGMFLFSGSTLTTAVNNMANTLIFIAIMTHLNRGMTKAEACEAIRVAARSVGYIVKVDVCDEIQQLQFLKHSPAINDDGNIEAYLNIGVWLRNFGRCKGDLPSRKGENFDSRVNKFNSEVVRSRIHAGNHAIHDAFLTKVIARDEVTAKFVAKAKSMTEDIEGEQLGRVSTEQLALRYGVPTSCIDHFCALVREAGPGQLLAHPFVRVVMRMDYGYE